MMVDRGEVVSGYRNQPEETSKVFDGGWFRTGDLGYFDDDGYLYVTGRVSTLIVTPGGKNIQPEAVEEAYLENPLIREIGVLQKDGRLVAVIVPETGEISRGSDIHRAMREVVEEGSKRLPSYQRISDYAIVPVVPVFIRGTYEAMPRGNFLRRLEQVTVTFGEPFDLRSFRETARPQEQIVEAVRERVAELSVR